MSENTRQEPNRHKLHLMTGSVDTDGSIVEGTMLPVRNTFVALGRGSTHEVLRTDETGALISVGSHNGRLTYHKPFDVKLHGLEERFSDCTLSILPENAVRDAWLSEQGTDSAEGTSKPWAEFLRSWARHLAEKTESAVRPSVKRFGKEHLIEGDATEHSLAYIYFRESVARADLPCLFIPHARAIFAVCSERALLKEGKRTVLVKTPYATSSGVSLELIQEEPDGKPPFRAAILIADPKSPPDGEPTLPEGVYTFTIAYSDLNPDIAWSEHVKRNGLVIQAHVTFTTCSVALEMAVVRLDPISLEDALLAQFPERFGPAMVEALDAGDNDQKTCHALDDWREKAQWVGSNYALGNSLVGPGGAYGKAKSLVEFGINHGGEKSYPPWFLDTFTLCTGGIDYVKQYCDFLSNSDNLDAIQRGLDALDSKTIKEAATPALNCLKNHVQFKSEAYRWAIIEEGVKARGEYAILDTAIDLGQNDFVDMPSRIEKVMPKVVAGAQLALEAAAFTTEVYDAFVKIKADGPSCAAPFHYVAYWVEKNPGFGNERGLYWGQGRVLEEAELPKHDDIDSPEIRDIVDTYVTSGFLELDTAEGSLYAGHFRFNYETPDGIWVDGLRPFGTINQTERSVHYRFGIRDTAGSKQSMVSELMLRLPTPFDARLPAGMTSSDLTPAFLDVSKTDPASVSLTREMARHTGR